MAGNFKESNYGKNRYSTDIVYSSATGDYGLTKEDFLASNPDLTEADYEYWKSWSDSDYRKSDRKDTVESKRTRAIEQFVDTELLSVESSEETVLESMEPTVNPYTYENALRIYKAAHLTEKQASRYEKHYIDGMSVRAIAEEEGVYHKAVLDSINQAKKKVKKLLSDS